MSHKNDTPNLTKKSRCLLKDWWSICLSYFFSCFNSWKTTSVYHGYFSGNLPAMLKLQRDLQGKVLLRPEIEIVQRRTSVNLCPSVGFKPQLSTNEATNLPAVPEQFTGR